MATACYINYYRSYSDRGAFVNKELLQTDEVDECEIKVGEQLPHWPNSSAPIVTGYQEGQLDLEYQGQSFTIKHGEEVLLQKSTLSEQYGVICHGLTCVKVIKTEIFYKGGWQFGDTILQKLAGPIGNGEVWYPTGDYFKGVFHLNYANIDGSAYAAEGRYEFADGSYIEHAWIHTSSDRKVFNLHGVFRVHHPNGPDIIAMFCAGNKRYGFELFLDEHKPKAVEWYANKRMIRWQMDEPEERDLEVLDYTLDEESRKNCICLTLTLKDGNKVYRVEQCGGTWSKKNYDQYYYEPSTRASVYLPNGDCLDHFGGGVRMFKPYHGFVEMHRAATGKYRSEQWEHGQLKEAEKWERDLRAAKTLELPDPFDKGMVKAHVWKDGYIEYGSAEWVYQGQTADNRPEGSGKLTGGRYYHEGECYEGEFHDGRCHGEGTYVHEKAGITQKGMWINGVFQEENPATAPIILHARHGHQSWSIGGSSDWEYQEEDFEAKLGRLGCFTGFASLEVARIEKNCLTLTRWGEKAFLLTPGETLHFSAEIEGREWSDGCVYSGDDYTLELTWSQEHID